MANFAFRRRDETALRFIDDCIEQAHNERKEYEPQWYENWSNYRVESTYGADTTGSKTYPYGGSGMGQAGNVSPINFLKTTESHQGVNTLRALLLASLFGTRDYVQADPVGDEDIEAAKRVSRLVMFGLERPGCFRTNYELIGDALIFGLGSYAARWNRKIRTVPRRLPIPDPANPGEMLRDPATGSIMSVLQNVPAIIENDPILETDDLFDTWFDPAADRLSELMWKGGRFKIRKDSLENLIGQDGWDEDGIRAVLRTEPVSSPEGPDGGKDKPKLITEGLTREDIEEVAKYGYYGGWRWEGTLPVEVAKELNLDPTATNVLQMVNGILIQAVQSPQRNGNIQGGAITILPTGRGIYGLSPLTVVRYLQDVSDTQLILTVQALIESVYQNYLISGEQGPSFKRDLETRRPREVFTLQGEIDQVQPLPKDYGGLQIAIGALNLISQTMRNAMSAKDPVQGIQGQRDRQTATESQLVATAALQNTDQLALLIERDELPTQGRLINDLYYVNLDDESKVFRRIGETETTEVSYFDIDAVTDINFVGARSVLNKPAKANQFRDFANMLAANPFVAASVDWHEFVRRYGDEALDVKGLERLMIQDPDEIVARLQSMGLANTVGPAQGGAGPGGNSPNAKPRRSPGNGGRTGGTQLQAVGEAS